MNNLLKQVYDIQSSAAVMPLRWVPKGACLHNSDYQIITSPLYPSGQNTIGRVKNMTSEESVAILRKAEKARDDRNGPRPAMSRENRIQAVQRFANRMVRDKDRIIELLMLEIGKSRIDAQAEFDRTITYIQNTIEAYVDDAKFGNYQQLAS